MWFLHDETGAVTVDWVVLTAAVVGLGLASANSLATGVQSLGSETETQLAAASVAAILPATRAEFMQDKSVAGCPMGPGQGIRDFGTQWSMIDGESQSWGVMDPNGSGFKEVSVSNRESYYSDLTDDELNVALQNRRSYSYGWDADAGDYDLNALFDRGGRGAARLLNLMVLECELASRG